MVNYLEKIFEEFRYFAKYFVGLIIQPIIKLRIQSWADILELEKCQQKWHIFIANLVRSVDVTGFEPVSTFLCIAPLIFKTKALQGKKILAYLLKRQVGK